MTAEEIRAFIYPNRRRTNKLSTWLREIAAQLAEQNDQMRQDREMRKSYFEDERAERIKRDKLIESSSAGIDAFRKNLENPPIVPIPPRVVFPGEIVHLGCLVREPDGTHCMVNEAGRAELAEDEAQRLLALLACPPTEAKPQ